MQLAADSLSFFLLRLQNLMGQMLQLFLQLKGLRQQLAGVSLAFLEGFFHLLPPDDFLFQLPVRGDPEPPCGVASLRARLRAEMSETATRHHFRSLRSESADAA